MAAPVEAKSALFALLQAHAWTGTTPSVRWGQPVDQDDMGRAQEFVYLGDVNPFTTQRRGPSANPGRLFTIVVVLDVRRYGNDEQATEQRAWQLLDDLDGLLHADPTINGSISHWAEYTVRHVNVPSPEQWRTQLAVSIACQAYPPRP